MKRVKLLIFLLPALILLFVLPGIALAETTELTAVADSFVNDGYPENNYASAHSFVISHYSFYRWSLVRFDLASIPEEATIDSATLKLYLYDSSGDSSIPTMTAKILNGWSETQVKWSNRPMFDESTGLNLRLLQKNQLNLHLNQRLVLALRLKQSLKKERPQNLRLLQKNQLVLVQKKNQEKS